jgi:hypothetical protein
MDGSDGISLFKASRLLYTSYLYLPDMHDPLTHVLVKWMVLIDFGL